MLFRASVLKASDKTILRMGGVVHAGIDFNRVVGEPPAVLEVDCAQILHLNASAVAPWLEYFYGLVERGTKVFFTNCTAPLVEYFNLVANFHCGGEILSVLAPYYCEICHIEVQLPLCLRDIPLAEALLEKRGCPSCVKSGLNLDDEFHFREFLRSRAESS